MNLYRWLRRDEVPSRNRRIRVGATVALALVVPLTLSDGNAAPPRAGDASGRAGKPAQPLEAGLRGDVRVAQRGGQGSLGPRPAW